MSNLSGVPPIATILTNLLLIILAAAVWRACGQKAMFAGALFALVVNGALAGIEWFFLVGNFVEVVFILSLLHTARRLETGHRPGG